VRKCKVIKDEKQLKLLQTVINVSVISCQCIKS